MLQYKEALRRQKAEAVSAAVARPGAEATTAVMGMLAEQAANRG